MVMTYIKTCICCKREFFTEGYTEYICYECVRNEVSAIPQFAHLVAGAVIFICLGIYAKKGNKLKPAIGMLLSISAGFLFGAAT